MSSILKPTPAQTTRRMAVLAAAAFAIVTPVVQNLAGLGLSQAEFAADGDETLRVAGYAFSIWGLIYLGVAAYAVRQALPQTGESPPIQRMGHPSIVAFVGIGLWIIAAAADMKAASVIIIFASLISLLVPLVLSSGVVRSLGPTERDRWLTAWPLAALAGWLTIAAPLNLITVATAADALPAAMSSTGWAILAIVIVTVVALLVTAVLRLMAYPLPIAWGLIGAFVAEQELKPVLAFTALGAALLIVVGAVIIVFRLRRDVVKPDYAR